jgi:hypothetical protein
MKRKIRVRIKPMVLRMQLTEINPLTQEYSLETVSVNYKSVSEMTLKGVRRKRQHLYFEVGVGVGAALQSHLVRICAVTGESERTHHTGLDVER